MAELRPSGAPGPTAPPAPGPAAPPAFASLFPPGLHAIYGECRRLYPDQPNPLQVTAIVKYWLGGPDPLDYVSMYRNVGSPSANIPEHWHYISFGLSDLYGDSRVHEFTGTDGPSGFGFELTFRLKRETGESAPPTWPAELMQGLARYVFQSENTFCSGDHVSWHSPLDNSESRIQHMLLTEDPQLQPVQTPFGVVTFLQIVGVCTEELHSAQQWNGQGILELLRTVPVAGGPWLITDMRRGETIFEIDPHLQQDRVDKGIETDGSNLSGVSAKCAWDDLSRPPEDDEDSRSICIGTQPRRLSGKDTEQIRETLRRGLEINSKPVLPPINPQRQNGLTHDRTPSRKDSLESESSTAMIPHELIRTRQLESVHLKFNQESGALIPLCLRGRLLHGRHFTYKSITGDMAITFVSTGVEGAFATEEHPYAAHGPWLQILLTEEFVEKMLEDLEDLTSPEELSPPHPRPCADTSKLSDLPAPENLIEEAARALSTLVCGDLPHPGKSLPSPPPPNQNTSGIRAFLASMPDGSNFPKSTAGLKRSSKSLSSLMWCSTVHCTSLGWALEGPRGAQVFPGDFRRNSCKRKTPSIKGQV
ncbi:PREDICTED: suppressor of fused homolog isoform X1 [Chinchilla lanigera]|uniref:suppressor of fused homolog isoform X1 n=1 Tax=Chinchilla lanigera TaxID=34839 RepID=UPI000697AC09|nr:PREDICTED: suppressor of fused homolog isoform X1 [Chinchilla lanigera]